MIVGVPKETLPGEARVALVPGALRDLAKAKLEVLVESGAGERAGHLDAHYREKGAEIVLSRAELFARADLIAQVRTVGANREHGLADLELARAEQIVVGLADPLTPGDVLEQVARAGVTLVAMELIPRITRAQSMDALSSMATISGYKAVLLAAGRLPKMFPMMMTAAGTLAPAKVFVIGAGVAGLQACATAKRLGAVVQAYDVRPAVKEQVESVGARFVELEVSAAGAEDAGGYAKALGEDFYRRQRELMGKVIAESDVVITTAAVPGKRAPVLVTADMVRRMAPGSVVVDLAAERGGNCELTRADEEVHDGGVTILGPSNLAATVPAHASQMYAKNLVTLLSHLIAGGVPNLDADDEITRDVIVTRGGRIVHPRVREILGLGPANGAAEEAVPPAPAGERTAEERH